MAERSPSIVTLKPLAQASAPRFKVDLQEAFTTAALGQLAHASEAIPSEEDIERSLFAPDAIAYDVVAEGVVVGGAIVRVDAGGGRNSLDFLFIKTSQHGKGFGQQAWRAIERHHPEAKAWETHTPYFDKRNIHFYVNRCGFSIVEFYIEERAEDPHADEATAIDNDGMFRLEKAVGNVFADNS